MNENGNKFAVLKTWPVANWEWPKIALFVPMIPALPFADDVFFNFLEIAQGGVPFFKLQYARTEVARNKAAQALLDSEFTHVLMLDSDHPHPVDIVQKLARRVIEDPKRLIVAAMAFRRGEPYDPIVWVKKNESYYTVHDWEHGACFEVDVIGTPAMLIHRSVFEQVSKPWFFYDYSMIDNPDFSWPTEDVSFCKKARSAGIKIWCDSAVITPHMRSVKVDERTYRTYCEMHPDKLIDPVVEKKALAIAERLHLTPEQLTAKVQMASANVKASWNKANPQTRDEVEAWYGSENSGYFFDLLHWNRTPFYQNIVTPLRQVKGQNVLVIGPGIGGEIDKLLEGGNTISVYDVPGALLDFIRDYYGDKITIRQSCGMMEFDLIVAVDVLEHIHGSAFPEFLQNLGMGLKPGGVLYCHNNFAQQDIYPMHYAENGEVFTQWVNENFEQTGDLTYQKKPVEVLV